MILSVLMLLLNIWILPATVMWRKDWKVVLIKEEDGFYLKNLISNAMKYTPEYGMVRVSVQENKDTWKLEVKDTGMEYHLKNIINCSRCIFVE